MTGETVRVPYAVEYRIERDGHLYSYMHVGEPPIGAQDVRWLYLDVAQSQQEPVGWGGHLPDKIEP